MCMTRRALLGALATSAATPLVAGVPLEAAKKDEIGEHILREAQRLGQNLQDGVRRHETITALAANFRLHAAHVRSTGIEVTVSQAVGRQVLKRGGRSGLIESSKSPQAMQRHHDQLQALGLEGLHVPERESTDAELDRAVTALMMPGALSGALDRMAAQFDQLAEQVAAAGRGDADRAGAGHRGLVLHDADHLRDDEGDGLDHLRAVSGRVAGAGPDLRPSGGGSGDGVLPGLVGRVLIWSAHTRRSGLRRCGASG